MTTRPILLSPFIVLAAISAALLTSCTQNQRVTTFGGAADLSIPAGQHVLTASFDHDNDLWVLTRPMRADEAPQTLTLTEHSSVGLLNGVFVLRESR